MNFDKLPRFLLGQLMLLSACMTIVALMEVILSEKKVANSSQLVEDIWSRMSLAGIEFSNRFIFENNVLGSLLLSVINLEK